jgi:hypothetical protein
MAPKAKAAAAGGEIVIPKPEIATITIGLVGTSPLIMHAWSEKAKRMLLERQMGLPVPKKQPKDPDEDYNGARYISSEGWDGIPATAFKAAMVGACRQVDSLNMTQAKRLFFVEADDPGAGLVRIYGEPEQRQDMVRLETGVADIRFRPQYWPWRCAVTVRFLSSIIKAEQVINLLMLAGLTEGVGEWRPSAPKSATGTYGLWEIEGAA